MPEVAILKCLSALGSLTKALPTLCSNHEKFRATDATERLKLSDMVNVP